MSPDERDARRMAMALLRIIPTEEAAARWEDCDGSSMARALLPGVRAALRLARREPQAERARQRAIRMGRG